MADTGRVVVDDSHADQGRRSAVLERAGGERRTLWFESHDGPLSTAPGADPFLLASLLVWMRDRTHVHVHGSVSRRLLVGLTEWQGAWARWHPDRYRPVRITVDEVRDEAPRSLSAVAAYSGGVDAAYTVRRHLSPDTSWDRVELRAALLVHGFDIPLQDEAAFASARQRAQASLADTPLRLLSLATNFRDLGQDWGDGHGLAVASCLAALAPEYGVGLIGSTDPYEALTLPWGSNPVTDHLCSTGLMDVRHDGSIASRTDKVAFLATLPHVVDHLRVCWQGERLDRNCGECEKCQRTLRNFRAAGVDAPACMPGADVRRVWLRTRDEVDKWRSLVRSAEERGCLAVAAEGRAVLRRSAPLVWGGEQPSLRRARSRLQSAPWLGKHVP